MSKVRRYLIRLAIALLAFIVSLFVYLILPPQYSSIKDVSHEAPITVVPDKQNNGERCRPDTVYVDKIDESIDGAVVEPFCADLQRQLVKSAREDDVATIRALLARGANLNSPGMIDAGSFMHPLPMAAMGRHWDAVRLLLDNGGDVNEEYVCCATQASPLILAVYQNNVDAVRLLLARGADVGRTDFDGETAFEIAAGSGYEDITRLFDEAGRLTWMQRAELRLARLPGMNLKKVHSAFIWWNLVKKPNHGVY